jgi:hypothetical protein
MRKSATVSVPASVLLDSDLVGDEDRDKLRAEVGGRVRLTAAEIVALDVPARNRVEALLRREFLSDRNLHELACDFAEHTLGAFEALAPGDGRPRRCVEVARRYINGEADRGELHEALADADAATMAFFGGAHLSAFSAGLATTLLELTEPAKHAREIAEGAYIAAYRVLYEAREVSGGECIPVTEEEADAEAQWQLDRIVKKLPTLLLAV